MPTMSVFRPGFMNKKNLVENPEVVLVGSNAMLIDENNNEIGHKVYPTY